MMLIYVGSKSEIAGKLSARAGIGEKELADIESVDVRQCRAASSGVESDERKLQDGIKNLQCQSIGPGFWCSSVT